MFLVYVLKSDRTGRRYVGCTGNLPERLKQHGRGKVRATKGGRPWRLVYTEQLQSNQEARRRERFLKSGQGRAQLDRILSGEGSAP